MSSSPVVQRSCTPIGKAMVGPVEMAAAGLHIVQVECELCVVEFNHGCRELRAGEFHSCLGKLVRWSVRCVRAGST